MISVRGDTGGDRPATTADERRQNELLDVWSRLSVEQQASILGVARAFDSGNISGTLLRFTCPEENSNSNN